MIFDTICGELIREGMYVHDNFKPITPDDYTKVIIDVNGTWEIFKVVRYKSNASNIDTVTNIELVGELDNPPGEKDIKDWVKGVVVFGMGINGHYGMLPEDGFEPNVLFLAKYGEIGLKMDGYNAILLPTPGSDDTKAAFGDFVSSL